MTNQPRMACWQILSQPLGNAYGLDEEVVGMQLAPYGLTGSSRFSVQVLDDISTAQRLTSPHT